MTTEKKFTTSLVVSRHEQEVDITRRTQSYLNAATSHNTRQAYRGDINHYQRWGGLLPATTQSIMGYLEAYASTLNPRTLARRLIALRHWHTYQGFSDPTDHPAVHKLLLGITHVHGRPKNRAPVLNVDDLRSLVDHLMREPSLDAIRDNALLQVGYFGALRRSELVNIHYEQIQWEKEGVVILLPSSKTDQIHEGQYCVLPMGDSHLCPVTALKRWLDRGGIVAGPVFRRILNQQVLGENALTPLTVNLILKKRAKEAQIAHSDQLSSHSLRRGLATCAARAGAPLHAIMRAGRWKQTNTVMEYIEESRQFSENAATSILKKSTRSNHD